LAELVVSFLPFLRSIAQYRAPEEYPGMEIYQGIDTFSLGNNIYTLLTGLWPFYDDESDFHRIQHKLINRERAYIDPRYSSRSYAENKLVEVMEHTWEFNPNDRISIFHVVKALRKAVRANKTFSKAGGQKRRLAHRAASNED
jgi:serine/threonine protein kinase